MAARPDTTGILMMNLGGPATLEAVGPFLHRLFTDAEIMQLPFQRRLGPFLARRRTAKLQELYRAIGGGDPILRWTEAQGRGLVERLDALSAETAPHRFYPAFRYAEPFSEDALARMQRDGVRRAVALSMYPQFSCTTTGSSLNELWRAARRLGVEEAFEWSVIDRWPTQAGLVAAHAEGIRAELELFEDGDDPVVVVFSAHSLPLRTIDAGDPYPHEVAATVHEVVRRLGPGVEHVVAYQSQVGPLRWQGPSTDDVIRGLADQGRRRLLLVPIAFTSDHIETLSEIDIEFAELAHALGIREFRRAPALNAAPRFLDALAELVAEHLSSGRACSPQYGLRCPGCTNSQCRAILSPVGSQGAVTAAPTTGAVRAA